MCGIAGLVLTPPNLVESERVRLLLNQLEHRGPDDAGTLSLRGATVCSDEETNKDFTADAVLVHRRLSILDLSKSGRQPMGTQDGRHYIVFNGEIYNYIELRAELETLGHRFRSRSDTEVLLAAYVEWGSQALNRLIGMFAFAILDVKARRIFLARDFFGIKPLYYAYWQRGLAFASEIKPLLELPGISRRANPQRLYDYLRFGITDHGEETLFLDIRQVPPGHYIETSLDEPEAAKPTRYWQIELNRRTDISFGEAAERVRDLFLENIHLHLRSDVPIGAALSGGIDSSAIVLAMRHVDPHLCLHTFSYIADDASISEERWVDVVSATAGARSHKVTPNPDELVSDLDYLVSVQGEPFGSTSIYAQRRVFQQAREAGIKVMLDGQGADEILGGYHYYIAARLGSLVMRRQWTDAVRLLFAASKMPGIGFSWLGLRTADVLIPSRFQRPLRAMVNREFNPSWMNMKWFDRHGVEQKIPTSNNGSCTNGNVPDLLRMSLYDTLIQTSLPQLLRYEDRNSMAFSIESRVPFLTPVLVQFMLGLPEEYIIAPDGTTKAVFRKAMRGIVPDAILDRRDKIGFAVPETNWLFRLSPWVERVLMSEIAAEIDAINLKELRREWERIAQSREYCNLPVWRWLNLVLWAQKFSIRFQ